MTTKHDERAELIRKLNSIAAQQEKCPYPIYGSVEVMRKAAALLAAAAQAGGEVVGRVNMWREDGHAQWDFTPDAAAWAQPDDTDEAKSRGARKSFTVYTRPQPAAQVAQRCGACAKPWDGEKCGQSFNGWNFPVCYPVADDPPSTKKKTP